MSLEAAAGSQIQTLEAVLQAMEARHASIEAATQVHLQAQEARLQSLEAGHASTLSELHKFVRPIVEFKTESAAIYNRYLILERLVREGVVSQANFSSQLEFANSRLNAYQVALDAKFADFATAWRDELAVETVRLNESISLTSKNINSTFERLDATNSILEQQKDILAHSITSLSEQISVNNSSARDIRSDFGDEIQLIRSELDRISTELGESLNSSSTSVESLKSALVEVNSQVVHGLAEKEDKISEMGGRLERLDESLLALKSEAGGQADPSDAKGLFIWPREDGLFLLKPNDLVSSFVVRDGAWDTHIIELMDDVVRMRNGTAIDIGAHFGLISVPMARRFNQVISFEPNDFNFRLLQANIKINNLENVTCENFPLYSSDVELSLGGQSSQETELPLDEAGRLDFLSAPNTASYMFSATGTGLFSHLGRSLDSLKLSGVVFIKVDVQGADGEVLLGARDTIRRCAPVIVFEWEALLSSAFSVTLDDVRAMFRELNYGLHVLKRHDEKQTDYVAYPAGATTREG